VHELAREPARECAQIRDNKIRLLGFTTLHDTRRYAIPQCWAPHTQTQRHGVLAMMNLILSYLCAA
jgi:hypothetical protein